MSISLTVEMSADEIAFGLSNREKRELLKELLKTVSREDVLAVMEKNGIDDGIIQSFKFIGYGIHEQNFNNALDNLSKSYMRLTVDDQNLIEQIAKKY